MTQDTAEVNKESFDDLQTLLSWLWSRKERIEGLAAEIEEVQRAFTTRLVRTQQALEDALVQFEAAVEAMGGATASWIADRLAERMPDMRSAKTQRLEELRARVQELETERAEIEEKSAAEREALAQANPALNAREEELKAERTRQKAEMKRLDEELEAAAAGLGWLFRAVKINQLRATRQRWETALYGTISRINEVRKAWDAQHDDAEESEAAYQSEWRQRTAELSQLSGELGLLERDLDGICRGELIREMAMTIEEFADTGAPAGDEALKAALTLRATIAELEEGITAVAGILGLLKGIQEGVKRFGESVESVKGEQDMHAQLSHLELEAPPEALEFHEVWDQLRPLVMNEKAAAEDPGPFNETVRKALGDRLNEDRIAGMFEALGGCLSEATEAQWD